MIFNKQTESKNPSNTFMIFFYKTILPLFFCVLLISSSIPGTRSFPRDIGMLRGKPKYMFAYNYSVKWDSITNSDKKLTDKSFVVFNDLGSSIMSDRYYSQGGFEEYFCRYDIHGNLLSMTIGTANLEGYFYPSERCSYLYDSANREIQCVKLSYTHEMGYEWKVKRIGGNLDSFLRIPEKTVSTYRYFKSGIKRARTIIYNDGTSKTDTTEYSNREYIFGNFYFPRGASFADTSSLYSTHRYERDSIGNWVIDSSFYKGELNEITYRRFEY